VLINIPTASGVCALLDGVRQKHKNIAGVLGGIRSREGKINFKQSQILTSSRTQAARFGQKECGANELNLNEAAKKDLFRNQVETIKRTRVRMHEFFDIYFYQQSLESNAKRPSRSIYLTFGSAVPIVLDRLMEVNANAGQLSNVTVVALPYGTESFNSPTITSQTLAQLYRFYSTLFKPLTDK
jgi:hypothetical protein